MPWNEELGNIQLTHLRQEKKSDFTYFTKMQTARSGKKDLIASELNFL